MSTVSATNTNTGIADLMQIFSNAATPALSSLLSSSQVQSALATASPADLVQLSDQALQLQEVDGLFGGSSPTQTENGFFGGLAPTETQTENASMESLLTSIYAPGSNVNLVG
jgi:hypothetical protein